MEEDGSIICFSPFEEEVDVSEGIFFFFDEKKKKPFCCFVVRECEF
jgi:hypothetical protein